MTGRASSTSTPTLLASEIRNDLLEGTIPPGSRLTEEALTSRFSVGRHSVRAAIQLLVAEGLVVHERHKGAVVPPITEARIDEMCSYRAVLELGALRIALARGATWDGVERAVEQLEAMPDDTPWKDVIDAHARIHREITAAGQNARILRAHGDSEVELTFLLASIKPDYSACRLAIMHRDLLDRLRVGGDVALRALEDDLELGGRAAMHLALRRKRESEINFDATSTTRPSTQAIP